MSSRRLGLLVAVLGVTSALSAAQEANVLEIARVNPEGAKMRTVPLEIAGQSRTVRIEDPAPITQAHVSRALVRKEKINVTSGDHPETKEISAVHIKFNGAGTKALRDLTTVWKGKMVAVVVEGKVISMPTIVDVIKGGELTISGTFSSEQAKAIAEKIQAAAGKNQSR